MREQCEIADDIDVSLIEEMSSGSEGDLDETAAACDQAEEAGQETAKGSAETAETDSDPQAEEETTEFAELDADLAPLPQGLRNLVQTLKQLKAQNYAAGDTPEQVKEGAENTIAEMMLVVPDPHLDLPFESDQAAQVAEGEGEEDTASKEDENAEEDTETAETRRDADAIGHDGPGVASIHEPATEEPLARNIASQMGSGLSEDDSARPPVLSASLDFIAPDQLAPFEENATPEKLASLEPGLRDADPAPVTPPAIPEAAERVTPVSPSKDADSDTSPNTVSAAAPSVPQQSQAPAAKTPVPEKAVAETPAAQTVIDSPVAENTAVAVAVGTAKPQGPTKSDVVTAEIIPPVRTSVEKQPVEIPVETVVETGRKNPTEDIAAERVIEVATIVPQETERGTDRPTRDMETASVETAPVITKAPVEKTPVEKVPGPAPVAKTETTPVFDDIPAQNVVAEIVEPAPVTPSLSSPEKAPAIANAVSDQKTAPVAEPVAEPVQVAEIVAPEIAVTETTRVETAASIDAQTAKDQTIFAFAARTAEPKTPETPDLQEKAKQPEAQEAEEDIADNSAPLPDMPSDALFDLSEITDVSAPKSDPSLLEPELPDFGISEIGLNVSPTEVTTTEIGVETTTNKNITIDPVEPVTETASEATPNIRTAFLSRVLSERDTRETTEEEAPSLELERLKEPLFTTDTDVNTAPETQPETADTVSTPQESPDPVETQVQHNWLPKEDVPVFTVTNSEELLNVMSSVTGGETIILSGSSYDFVRLSDFNPDSTVRLVSENRDDPASIREMIIKNASNIEFDGVHFELPDVPRAHYQQIVALENTSNITFKNSIFSGTEITVDASGEKYGSGVAVLVRGSDNITLDGNEFYNLYTGVGINTSSNLTLTDNEIYGIRSDGFNFASVQNVLIEDNHFHDFNRWINGGDHADMLQFWSTATTVPSTDITIRGNIFDSAQGDLTQSIFMRNDLVDTGKAGREMFYQNILIEDNLIHNGSVHGITVGETVGVTIRNNTVLNNTEGTTKTENPKIIVAETSVDVILDSNVAHAYWQPPSHFEITNHYSIQNYSPDVAGYYSDVFVDPFKLDADLSDIAPIPDGDVETTGVGATDYWDGSL